MSTTIPTIDLSLPRLTLIELIRTACLTHGFFHIISHEFPPLLTQAAFEYSKHLFALPTAEKNGFTMSENHFPGYQAFQSYSLDKTNTTADLNEGFGMTAVCYDDETRWPAETAENELIGFKACCQQYHAAMEKLSKKLAGYIAEGLGLEEGYFEEYFVKPMTQVRLIHYFQGEEADIVDDGKPRIGAGLHSDWGLFTILSQDNVGGLEVYDPDSESLIPVRIVILRPVFWFGMPAAGYFFFFDFQSRTYQADRTTPLGAPAPRCTRCERWRSACPVNKRSLYLVSAPGSRSETRNPPVQYSVFLPRKPGLLGGRTAALGRLEPVDSE